jgi:hypothetical protein
VERLEDRRLLAVVFRVNAGGPALAGTPAWSADTAASPSSFVNTGAIYSNGAAISMSHGSIPAGTPVALFQSERWDEAGGAEMQWDFPVTPGSYEVRLYFADIYSGTQSVGARVFDVSIEGVVVLDNYDIYADVGGYAGVMKSFIVQSNANLDIDFGHVTENPAIKGIEILSASVANTLGASPASIAMGSVDPGTTQAQNVLLTNLGSAGDPTITISNVVVTGGGGTFTASLDAGAPVVLPPGASTNVTVEFTPSQAAFFGATLQIVHSGGNALSVPLSGNGGVAFGFGKSSLVGAAAINPTSLQFGPDGRLYVAQQDGTIHIYNVARNGANAYVVTATETIELVKDIPNHNDMGVPQPFIDTRLVTGILVTGTASNPVLYVSSSDPRIGAGPDGTDLNLDTNRVAFDLERRYLEQGRSGSRTASLGGKSRAQRHAARRRDEHTARHSGGQYEHGRPVE